MNTILPMLPDPSILDPYFHDIHKNYQVNQVDYTTLALVNERLERIEMMLKLTPILHPSEHLLEKYEELRNAFEEYKKLEQKYITWENLSNDTK